MPAAPAARTSATRSGVIPPTAMTGGRRPPRRARARRAPAGHRTDAWTACRRPGRRRESRRPRLAASRACASECDGGADEEARGPDPAQRAVGQRRCVRCTPSAPTASATSARSLTMSLAPCRRVEPSAPSATESRSRGARSFSRSCTASKPRVQALVHDSRSSGRATLPVRDETERELAPSATERADSLSLLTTRARPRAATTRWHRASCRCAPP